VAFVVACVSTCTTQEKEQHLPSLRVVDIALIAAGVAATILLPEVPMLGSMLIGAGISGLQYDGEAAFNAVVYDKYEISDADWGISLGIGAAMGAFEGLGAFKYAGKAASNLAKGSGITKVAAKVGAKVGTKFGVGSSVGKYTIQQVEKSSIKTIAKSVAKTVGKGALGVAKEVGKGVGTQVGLKMLDNVREGNDIWEGVAKEALDSVVSGVIGGGMSLLNNLNARSDSLYRQ
jgi:hypothetical protein